MVPLCMYKGITMHGLYDLAGFLHMFRHTRGSCRVSWSGKRVVYVLAITLCCVSSCLNVVDDGVGAHGEEVETCV
jgi:hypothetical protein